MNTRYTPLVPDNNGRLLKATLNPIPVDSSPVHDIPSGAPTAAPGPLWSILRVLQCNIPNRLFTKELTIVYVALWHPLYANLYFFCSWSISILEKFEHCFRLEFILSIVFSVGASAIKFPCSGSQGLSAQLPGFLITSVTGKGW